VKSGGRWGSIRGIGAYTNFRMSPNAPH